MACASGVQCDTGFRQTFWKLMLYIVNHLFAYITTKIESVAGVPTAHQASYLPGPLLKVSYLQDVYLAVPSRMTGQQFGKFIAQLLYRYGEIDVNEYCT